MIIAIAAMDPTGIIAIDGQIPWHYREDLKRFKVLTKGCIIIMGRKTWETFPKPLPERFHVVLSRQPRIHTSTLPDQVYSPPDIGSFLRGPKFQHMTVYVIGGAEIYRAALESGAVDEVDLTIVPKVDVPPGSVVTRFPGGVQSDIGNSTDLLSHYTLMNEGVNPHDPRLLHRRYIKP